MARTSINIWNGFVKALVAQAAAVGIVIDPTKWRKTDYKGLTLFVISEAQGFAEQLYDSLVTKIEAILRVLPPSTPPWIQDKMLNLFQYNATDPQLLIINASTNFTPRYSKNIPSYKIIKNCSVTSGFSGSTTIKIAGAGPSPITGSALIAAQTFLNQLKTSGLNWTVTSSDSDKLFIQVNVWYNGLYSAVIQASVIAAITSYLSSIPFDGVVTLSLLEVSILSVPGVNDVSFVNVQSRADTTAFGSGTNLVLNSTELLRNCSTFAGYIVPETAAGGALLDYRSGSSGPLNLNLIAE